MKVLRFASHIHTEASDDCDWPLDRIASVLRRFGFDGALVCDHDRTMSEDRRLELVRRCAEVTDAGFTVVPGVEYQDVDHRVHLPVFGDIPFLGRGRDLGEIIREAHRAGGVSVFAHPRRRDAFEAFDPDWLPGLTGVEVWNRKYDGVQPNRWALDLAARHGLARFVGLDFHGPRQLVPLAVTVPVTNDHPSWESVLAAMRSGRTGADLFGVDVERFSSGTIGAMVRQAERLRVQMAPRLRVLEQRLRSGRTRS